MATERAPVLLSVDDFDSLVQRGYWQEDDAVELLEGQVAPMSPVGDRHAYVVGVLDDLLREVYGRSVKVWQQQPLRLPPFSEPVPDVALLRPRADNYRTLPGAEDVLLVIEVADSSVSRDRDSKARVYATAGIREYWVVDLPGQVVWTYRSPTSEGYQVIGAARAGDQLRAEWEQSRAVPVDAILS